MGCMKVNLFIRYLVTVLVVRGVLKIEAIKQKEEPKGFQFRALLFGISTESKEALYDELTEPWSVIKHPQGFMEHSIESMILIKLKIVNKGNTPTGVSFLCIDHVYDREKGTVYKLLNTFVFKIKQDQLSLVYDLNFIQVVNGLPQEEVINKMRADFRGCTTEGDHATCGLISFNNNTIPFSEGFCCSCDPNVNKEREKQLIDQCIENEKNKYYNISTDGCVNVKYLHAVEMEGDKREKNLCPDHDVYKRTIEKTGIQIRGGQSCIDRYYPLGADPIKYHESAHCLRYSKIWYNVYKLHEPKLENIVFVKMFRKRHPERGGSSWLEVTRTTPSILGSSFRSFSSDRYQTLFTYSDSGNEVPHKYKLSSDRYLLKPRLDINKIRHPLVRGGAKEYLHVDTKLFDFEGSSCNKIGVSFTAFAKQKNRCGVPRGTCLYNQPYALWIHDKKRERRGLRGSYTLKNFGIISDKDKNSLAEDRLHLDFQGYHVTKMSIASDNFVENVISTTAHGILSEIYIDAANEYSTSFIINMINDGLVESTYRVALANLPHPIPKVWHATPSKPFVIAPHNGYSIRLQMYGKLPLDKFRLTVELQTDEGEVVSSRRAVVQNNDRCYCVWECECACEGSELGLRCQVLDEVWYSKAGYQGDVPPRRPTRQHKKKRDTSSLVHHHTFTILANIIVFTLTLLIMGIILGVVRGIVYLLVYCMSHANNRPVWNHFHFKCLDGALIPLFICCNKKKLSNNLLLNIFYFLLVPVAFLCFLFHILTLREELFGKKESKCDGTPHKVRKDYRYCQANKKQKKPLLHQPTHHHNDAKTISHHQQTNHHNDAKTIPHHQPTHHHNDAKATPHHQPTHHHKVEKAISEENQAERNPPEKNPEIPLEEEMNWAPTVQTSDSTISTDSDTGQENCLIPDDPLLSKKLWIEFQKKQFKAMERHKIKLRK